MNSSTDRISERMKDPNQSNERREIRFVEQMRRSKRNPKGKISLRREENLLSNEEIIIEGLQQLQKKCRWIGFISFNDALRVAWMTLGSIGGTKEPIRWLLRDRRTPLISWARHRLFTSSILNETIGQKISSRINTNVFIANERIRNTSRRTRLFFAQLSVPFGKTKTKTNRMFRRCSITSSIVSTMILSTLQRTKNWWKS